MTLNVKKLQDGTIELWDFFEEGGPIVRCLPDGTIKLYEVPHYGGEEQFIGIFPTIQAALKESESWTYRHKVRMTSRVAIAEANEIIKSRRARFATADALLNDLEEASRK